jgi:ribose transport system ATP-binding protein
MPDPVVRLRGVSKRFGATRALESVDFDVLDGEIHALVGQNGAGKSTLGKVLGGIHERDKGDFIAFGKSVDRWSPRLALEHGIAMIQQELSLVPGLSVAENVFLGLEEDRFGLLTGRLSRRFEALNSRAGFRLHPDARVADLPIADRQKVEILRALARDARLIIMDEPTSALSIDEVEQLHRVISWLREDGRTVVYVSHFLEEILSLSERVTVMRDGRIVRTSEAASETKESLVTAMLGRPMELTFPDPPPVTDAASSGPPALRVDRLSAPPAVKDASFMVYPGEIVGLAGLVGSGRSETLRAIFGADPAAAGSVEVAGERYERRSPVASIERGIGMIPEDRRGKGLIGTMTVQSNVTLSSLRRFVRLGVIRRRRESSTVLELLKQLDVVPQRPDAHITTLSGGNQQKVLFGRWLDASPRVLLLDEPTRGIDIGAKLRIYELIVQLAAEGLGVVFVSSELEEVMSLSSRVYLIHAGSTVGEVDPRSESMEDVLFTLFGLDKETRTA